MAHQSQDVPAIQTALITSMLLGKQLLKQCMLKENKVKLEAQPQGDAVVTMLKTLNSKK
jgi:hypothetical protein